jgi:hypothetical protein
MKPLATLYQELESIDLSQEGMVAKFEAVLSEIGSHKDVGSILELTRFFDDDSEYDEAMFSIVHLVESFDDERYVSKLLEASPEFCETKPRWASIVFMRVLNSESAKRELIRQLRISSPNVKNVIRALMEKINARSVKFLEKTTPVLVATGV